ncbi:MAG: antibiotic biosynthesis monooxygenase [Candidatus Eisenbacteria bacterium]|nr:antibiotic biosynthesis monooxygenase [Candidatus Eisenbacteria bacterium]
MLVIVWEYRVKRDRVEEFETLYRPDGAWGDLFREAAGFVSVTLMKDLSDPARFVVADRWTSLAAYENFKRERAAEYAALSERGHRWIERESEIGRFDFVD